MAGKDEFSFKKIFPGIGGGRITGSNSRVTSSFDLVEQMNFLYVKLIRAINCPVHPETRICDPFVEITLGNCKASTKNFPRNPNLEWDQVFAFDKTQGDVLQVALKERQLPSNHVFGKRQFSLTTDIPTRVPPDASIAPQWYSFGSIDDGNPNADAELLMSVWFGTQADENYSVAWHSDASAMSGECVINTRPKVYLSPRLCYVRLSILSAHDLIPRDRNRKPNVYVKAVLGNIALKTKLSSGLNPSWNQDLMFVAAEPFNDTVFISVMDRLDDQHEECIGKFKRKVSEMTPITIPKAAPVRFCDLEPPVKVEPAGNNNFASRLRMRLSMDQAYHVFDESVRHCSDYRAYVTSLWPGQIGSLEIGILGATGLQPMKFWKDGRKSTDPYAVAKYGNKWVRTRTIVDNLAPKWNEQYTWEVYDVYTVVTIGVYDNCQLYGCDVPEKDACIGKMRIRLSSLKACKVYAYSFPIVNLRRDGVKKMGDIQLALRLNCPSWYDSRTLRSYFSVMLPKMHYKFPLSGFQTEALRQQAVQLTCLKLARTEPPLRREVVEDMLSTGANKWSMRKAKANFERLTRLTERLLPWYNRFNDIRRWKRTEITGPVFFLFVLVVRCPDLILPAFFLYCFVMTLWNFWYRPQHPRFIDPKLSKLDSVHPDEIDEEFDTFPSSVTDVDILRMRYDRLRKSMERIVMLMGDVAAQAERVEALVTWQDHRITAYFMIFCLCAGVVLYWVPFWFAILVWGGYVMRFPYFRVDLPNNLWNLFRRLPTKEDCMY